MVKQEPAAAAATPTRKKERKSKKKKRKKTNSPIRLDRSKTKNSSRVIVENAKGKRDRIPSASKPFERPDTWRDVAQPHLDSFNFMLGEGIQEAVRLLPRIEVPSVLLDRQTKVPGVTTPERVKTLSMWIEDVKFGWPLRNGSGSDDVRLFPSECRELGITYAAPLTGEIKYRIDNGPVQSVDHKFGDMPIMVNSDRCHYCGMPGKELVKRHEDANHFGGYFIVNGNEKIMRMLQVPRRNHIFAIERGAFSGRGTEFTNLATSIRCVRADESGQTISVHYLNNGSANVRVVLQKQEFFIPVYLLLRALKSTTDKEIFEGIMQGDYENCFFRDRAEVIIRSGADKCQGLFSKKDCLAHIGSAFRALLNDGTQNSTSDWKMGEKLVQEHLFVHLDRGRDKFNLLIMMLRKLFAVARGDCDTDNADALSSQELLVSGHLYLKILKEKLYNFLRGVKLGIIRELSNVKLRHRVNFHDSIYIENKIKRQADIGRQMQYFLATGNLKSDTGLDLMQAVGFAILGEKLNIFRYLSHFRSVHRGAYFAEMKTTTVRKLLPESWGFLCCVHTPDGAPCGLLSHLTSACKVVASPEATDELPAVLEQLGMVSLLKERFAFPPLYLPVMLDGKLVGAIAPARAEAFVRSLRVLKVTPKTGVPSTTEIAFVPPTPAVFPGVFLACGAARMIRPVRQCRVSSRAARTGRPARAEDCPIEWISTLEQVFMDIACHDTVPKGATHQELGAMCMLSYVASLTPFSDNNQSPRNMYQCQMAKQTMGTPCHNFRYRMDNKFYRIQTPQAPLVQNEMQAKLKMDDMPNGTNAVVAVISYTGYDMEDAMIICKGSYERGFGHGSVYKTFTVDAERDGHVSSSRKYFGLPKKDKAGRKGKGKQRTDPRDSLDEDGLVRVGTQVSYGDYLYCVVDDEAGSARFVKHKSHEPAIVEDVCILAPVKSDKTVADASVKGIRRIRYRLRFRRNPVVGDKFSSRHGQKGVLSCLYPQKNMPFSGSGINPDIIINPHAFPSRMTIGMLLESMAAKSGALRGKFQNSTPFRFNEAQPAVHQIGEQLKQSGFNYFGSETLYSGITGEPMTAEIFIGIVYYQRLRHMVLDKSQVRATGPIDPNTRQPVKGRKKHGGIRFGEMERDSLIGHGASFLLHDRLMNVSDRHVASACSKCGSLVSVCSYTSATDSSAPMFATKAPSASTKEHYCKICGPSAGGGSTLRKIVIPYVVRYLVNELAAMNIKTSFELGVPKKGT